jgi:hypothetical protein
LKQFITETYLLKKPGEYTSYLSRQALVENELGLFELSNDINSENFESQYSQSNEYKKIFERETDAFIKAYFKSSTKLNKIEEQILRKFSRTRYKSGVNSQEKAPKIRPARQKPLDDELNTVQAKPEGGDKIEAQPKPNGERKKREKSTKEKITIEKKPKKQENLELTESELRKFALENHHEIVKAGKKKSKQDLIIEEKEKLVPITPRENAMREKILQEDKEMRENIIATYLPLLNKCVINQFLLKGNLINFPIVSPPIAEKYPHYFTKNELKASEMFLLENFVNMKKLEKPLGKNMHNIPSVNDVHYLVNKFTNGLIKFKLDQIDKFDEPGYKEKEAEKQETAKKIRKYLKGKIMDQEFEMPHENMKKFDPILKNINKVYLLDEAVAHKSLFYKGRIDCLAEFNGELSLIFWKISQDSYNKMENVADLFDFPIKCVAQMGALYYDPVNHKRLDGREIKNLIIMSLNLKEADSEVNVHLINKQLTEAYWYKWLENLRRFWFILGDRWDKKLENNELENFKVSELK